MNQLNITCKECNSKLEIEISAYLGTGEIIVIPCEGCLEAAAEDSYRAGIETGESEGYQIGYEDGYAEGYESGRAKKEE